VKTIDHHLYHHSSGLCKVLTKAQAMIKAKEQCFSTYSFHSVWSGTAEELCQCTFFSDANSNRLALTKLTCLVRKFQLMRFSATNCTYLWAPNLHSWWNVGLRAFHRSTALATPMQLNVKPWPKKWNYINLDCNGCHLLSMKISNHANSA